MHASLLLLAASAVVASPSYPKLTADNPLPGAVDAVSAYFGLLAEKVQAARIALPGCDLSNALFPVNTVSPALPPPSAGLVLRHVAIGRGTQNYTCDLANATAVPAATGAVATLFNASCAAAAYPDLLAVLPRAVLAFNRSGSVPDDGGVDTLLAQFGAPLYPTNLPPSGHHYFLDKTTPFFDLDAPAPATQLGAAACAKNNTQAAPPSAATVSTSALDTADAAAVNVGQQGEAAVPWLKLVAKAGTGTGTGTGTGASSIQEVYRLQTVGGSAPATCVGMPAAFTVQYAAQYWFYGA